MPYVPAIGAGTRLPKEIQDLLSSGIGIERALTNYFAVRRTRKIFTTRLYKYETSTSPIGVKLNHNADMFCEPSTNTYAGRDDYQNEGLFQHWDCNWVLDENGFIKITALQGMPDFRRAGKVDVGVVTMSAFWGVTETDEYYDVHYSDSPNHAMGLAPIPESVNPDGTISPWMVHGKYGAGDIDGIPYSSAGLILANGGGASGKPINYYNMIAYMHKKGMHYCGTTNSDLLYRQLMMIIKYSKTHSQSVMGGCTSYSYQYAAVVEETSVNRIIITKVQAANFFVGGYVSVGDRGTNTSTDRNNAYMHNKAYTVQVTKIEDVDSVNTAVYVDAAPFDTTATTYISSMPWRTGSTDSVLGSDGSPFSNTNNKNCYKIQGIETSYGAYEVLGNVVMDIVTGEDGIPKRDVYISKDASTLSTIITTVRANYKKAGAQVAYTSGEWKYISEHYVDTDLGIMIPTKTAAGSATGYADGLLTDTATTGQREWLASGPLLTGASAGLWILNAYTSWAYGLWHIVSGVSPNGTRGEWSGVA